jgi:hypothetical protein
LVTKRNPVFGITSKGDAQGVESGPGMGRASFAQTFTAIMGFSKHAGRYGAGGVIPFQLGIRFHFEPQLTKMDLRILWPVMRTISNEAEIETT